MMTSSDGFVCGRFIELCMLEELLRAAYLRQALHNTRVDETDELYYMNEAHKAYTKTVYEKLFGAFGVEDNGPLTVHLVHVYFEERGPHVLAILPNDPVFATDEERFKMIYAATHEVVDFDNELRQRKTPQKFKITQIQLTNGHWADWTNYVY